MLQCWLTLRTAGRCVIEEPWILRGRGKRGACGVGVGANTYINGTIFLSCIIFIALAIFSYWFQFTQFCVLYISVKYKIDESVLYLVLFNLFKYLVNSVCFIPPCC